MLIRGTISAEALIDALVPQDFTKVAYDTVGWPFPALKRVRGFLVNHVQHVLEQSFDLRFSFRLVPFGNTDQQLKAFYPRFTIAGAGASRAISWSGFRFEPTMDIEPNIALDQTHRYPPRAQAALNSFIRVLSILNVRRCTRGIENEYVDQP